MTCKRLQQLSSIEVYVA